MSKLKVVYVVCAESLDYLYLLAANAMLARLVMPECPLVCVVDSKSLDFASRSGFRFSQWVDEVQPVKATEGSSYLISRFLKTTLRSLVPGDYLYLDVDAVPVRRELVGNLDVACIAAAPNLDHLRLVPAFPEEIGREIYEPLGWDYPFLPYVNGGVLFCRDTPEAHRLYGRWHELWLRQRRTTGVFLDQPSLNRALWENPGCLTLMPSSFNSPVDVGPDFEAGAWVYHYYISIYSGRPRRDSLLGIVARELQRRGSIGRATLRFLLRQGRAFIPEAYDLRRALKARLFRHAWNLWRDGSISTHPTQTLQPFRFRASGPATNQQA